MITLTLTELEANYVSVALEFQLEHDDDSLPPHVKHGESALTKVQTALMNL